MQVVNARKAASSKLLQTNHGDSSVERKKLALEVMQEQKPPDRLLAAIDVPVARSPTNLLQYYKRKNRQKHKSWRNSKKTCKNQPKRKRRARSDDDTRRNTKKIVVKASKLRKSSARRKKKKLRPLQSRTIFFVSIMCRRLLLQIIILLLLPDYKTNHASGL